MPSPAALRTTTVVTLSSVVSAALVAQLVLGKAARDALFVAELGAEHIPRAALLGSALSAVALLVAARTGTRTSPTRALAVALGVNLFALAGEGACMAFAPRATAIVFYLHAAALAGPLVSMFWVLMTERFDPHAARRAFGFIGAGGSVGGALGGGIAWLLGEGATARHLFSWLGLLNVMALGGTALLGRDRTPVAPPMSPSAPESLSLAFPALAKAPYLQRLAGLVLVVAAAESILDFLLISRIAAMEVAPLPFLGAFYVGISLCSALVLLVVGPPLLSRLGLTAIAGVLPVGLVAFGLLGAVVPGIALAVAARGIHGVLRTSLFRSAFEIFFTPLPPAAQRRLKLLIDVGFDRAGAMFGSAVALVVVAAPPALAARMLAVALAAFGVAALAALRGLKDGYVAALEQSLRRGTFDPARSPVIDATTMMAITQTQNKIDREALLRQIAELRAEQGEGRRAEMDLALRALKSHDRALRGTAIEYLGNVEPSLKEPLKRVGAARPLPSRPGPTS